MAQTIKHRRGKLESIAGSVTPINGELIIASGSDLAAVSLYTSPSPRDLSTSRMPSSA